MEQTIPENKFEPGDRGYIFGFNVLDVGELGSPGFKNNGQQQFGVACVKIVQLIRVIGEDKKVSNSMIVQLLNAKGEPIASPNNPNKLAMLNMKEEEVIKDPEEIESIILEKLEITSKNAKLLLNNSLIDAKSAFKRSSKIKTT